MSKGGRDQFWRIRRGVKKLRTGKRRRSLASGRLVWSVGGERGFPGRGLRQSGDAEVCDPPLLRSVLGILGLDFQTLSTHSFWRTLVWNKRLTTFDTVILNC